MWSVCLSRLTRLERRIDLPQLDSILWAYAVMRGEYTYSTQRVFNSAEVWLIAALGKSVPLSSMPALSRILWSFAAMNRKAPQLFSLASPNLQRGRHTFSDRDVNSIVWSYTRLGYDSPFVDSKGSWLLPFFPHICWILDPRTIVPCIDDIARSNDHEQMFYFIGECKHWSRSFSIWHGRSPPYPFFLFSTIILQSAWHCCIQWEPPMKQQSYTYFVVRRCTSNEMFV